MGLKVKLICAIGMALYFLGITIWACVTGDAVGAAGGGAMVGLGVWAIYEVIKWEVEHKGEDE